MSTTSLYFNKLLQNWLQCNTITKYAIAILNNYLKQLSRYDTIHNQIWVLKITFWKDRAQWSNLTLTNYIVKSKPTI